MRRPPEHNRDLLCIMAAICQSGSNQTAKTVVDLAEAILAEVSIRHPDQDWSDEPVSTVDPDPPPGHTP